MTTADLVDRGPARSAPARAALAAAGRLPGGVPVLLVLLASVLARLPLLTRPLSPDEGGYAMVAAQWSPGTSLYGSYWVDRPPLLITLFRLADLLGSGPVGVRLVGLVAVGSAVLLAAALGRAVTGLEGWAPEQARRAPVVAASTAAVFLASPLFGAGEVDGELLAAPFLLAGLTAVVRAAATPCRRTALSWWTAAGTLAVAAAAVKQDMLDVFVAAAVVAVLGARRRATPRHGLLAPLAAFGAGAVACGTTLLAWTALHGTDPAALWDAVVTFRLEAATVIARSAPHTTSARATGVLAASVGSGALALVVVGLVPTRSPRPATGRGAILLAGAVLAWELVGVVGGGSYWLHYLVGTVPGLVLAAVAAAGGSRVRRRALRGVLLWAAAVAAVEVAVTAVTGVGTNADDVAVSSYLVRHEQPGDTGVVAFGDPVLLQAAHLPSPYAELWSLPVRVRDPDLVQLAAVLRGPDRPTWLVVDGTSLATWGVDPARARPLVHRDYELVHVVDHWRLFHVRPG
jgi:hypothetical protein